MSRFFINRPIVAMVISIIMVIVGVVSFLSLPVAQYPNIVPPEIAVNTTYVGADALTVEQSVATPIEQQMSGVDHMNYMYSLNASNGTMKLTVDYDIATDPNIDQVLTQMRESQAESQLPSSVRDYGITVAKSTAAPLMVISLSSPSGQFDSKFLANYAYINLNDPIVRVPGIASVTVFGAGQYALRIWVDPNKLAALNITTPEIEQAISAQNTVNPAGQVGGEPIPPGQAFTNTVLAQGRLVTEEQFGNIVIRAEPNGAYVRVRDVGRVELGAQTYSMTSTFNGKPAAALAIYQLPGSNAVDAAKGVRQLMEQLKERFPSGIELFHRPGHNSRGDRRDGGNLQDPGGSDASGHPCRIRFPPRLASDSNPVVCRAGFAGQHIRRVSSAGVFGQHVIAPRTRPGHWSRRR